MCLSRDPRIPVKMTRKSQVGSCPPSHQPYPQERIQKKIQARERYLVPVAEPITASASGPVLDTDQQGELTTALIVRLRFQNRPP